jgi:hypothetical protein
VKLVALQLSEDSSVVHTIAGDFSPEELDTLAQYVNLMRRIRTCALLSRGMAGFGGMKFDSSGITIRSSSPSPSTDSELHELLHVMRPVTLEKERASFKNIRTILGRRFLSKEFAQFLKINKRIFRDGEMSLYMQVTVNTQKLFSESLLNTWLNGTQYHTYESEAQAWSKLETSLGEANAKVLVLSQLHSKVKALMNMDYVAQRVVGAPDGDA